LDYAQAGCTQQKLPWQNTSYLGALQKAIIFTVESKQLSTLHGCEHTSKELVSGTLIIYALNQQHIQTMIGYITVGTERGRCYSENAVPNT
jgi:hypothetical protein